MRARKALLRTVFFALPLALLELGARLVFDAPEAGLLAHRPANNLYPGIADPDLIFEELSGETLEWAPYEHFATKAGLRGKHFSTNSLGLRGPEILAPKPKGVYRIAVLGGSTAWGYGSSSNETTVPGYLQTYLRNRLPHLKVEVVNAGKPGYVSTQELILFHRVVSQLEPDLVLLFDGYNDIAAAMINGQLGLPQNAALLRSRYEASFRGGMAQADLMHWLRRSRILSAILNLAAPQSTDLMFPDARATAGSYLHNVQAIMRLAAPARVVAAPQPSLASTDKPLSPQERQMLEEKESAFPGYVPFVRACSRAMDDALRNAGLDVIELDDALGREPRLLFADECHLGDEAAEKLAHAVGSALRGSLPATGPGVNP